MWSGEISSRRVDLSGASKKQKRSDHLKKARKARLERAALRRRLTAAVTIQSSWRSIRCLKKLRLQHRNAWDQRMMQLRDVGAALRMSGIEFLPPVPSICALLREFLFFFNPRDAASLPRLLSVCKMLQQSAACPNTSQNYCSLAASDKEAHVWLCQMQRFLCSSLLAVLPNHNESEVVTSNTGLKTETCSAVLDVLLTVGNSDNWSQEMISHLIKEAQPSEANIIQQRLQVLSSRILLGEVKTERKESSNSTALLHCKKTGLTASRDSIETLLSSLKIALNRASRNVHIDSNVLVHLCNLCKYALCRPTLVERKSLQFRRGVHLFGRLILSAPGLLFRFDFTNKHAIVCDETWEMLIAIGTEPGLWKMVLEELINSIESVAWQRKWSTTDFDDIGISWLAINILILCHPGYVFSTLKSGGNNVARKNTTNITFKQLQQALNRTTVMLRLLCSAVRTLPLQLLCEKTESAMSESEGVTISDSDSDDENCFGEEGLARIARRKSERYNKNSRIEEHSEETSETVVCDSELTLPISRAALAVLYHPSFIRSTFEDAVDGTGVDNAIDIDGDGVGSGMERLFVACNLYRTLFDMESTASPNKFSKLSFRQQKSSLITSTVLNTLAFSPHAKGPLVARLWRRLTSTFDLDAFARNGEVPRSADVKAVFHVCVAAYSQLLDALDDEEFYERQVPFRLVEVQRMIVVLRELLRRFYWTGIACTDKRSQVLGESKTSTSKGQHSVSLLSPRDFETLRVATRLFNQLYDRDCRRGTSAICKRSDWLWPTLPEADLSAFDLTRGVVTRGSIVLSAIPQVIPFHRRASIFYDILREDRAQHQSEHGLGNRITIRRDYIFEDAVRAFNILMRGDDDMLYNNGHPHRLKQRMQITFVDEHGQVEPGIDGGGLFKDFMDLLTKRCFDPRYALFRSTSENLLYPNPTSATSAGPEHLENFEFLGRVLGKALYESILVEPKLARFFLNKVLGKVNMIDELQSLDPVLYRNLLFLKNYSDSPVEDLCLHFSVSSNQYGETKNIPLIPGGENVVVTSKNRIKYIVLMANHKLNVEIGKQCAAFLKGLRSLIPVRWLSMFSSRDMQRLIGGTDAGLDLNDMKKYTRLTGGYDFSLTSDRVNGKWFFDVLRDFTPEEHAKLLKFATSCSRPPLLGFSFLNPPFTIQRVNIKEDNERLPTASTCMNLLKLPTYSSKKVLKEKLLFVISCDAGFELS